MPRPVKWRRIESLPEYRHFVPIDVSECELEENVLKVEELEAIRLRDLEGLDQATCAERMEVSRQTFQRIYNSAKKKVADSLINGKAVRIKGGKYTQQICKLVCEDCGYTWENRVEDLDEKITHYKCPECGSEDVHCDSKPMEICRRRRCGGRGLGLGRHRRRGRMDDNE
ncbi:DUF134 domain-containing protein [Caldisalinibacter kiritimatiensis]|uniref:UPF0251 protein L21TH_1705 n=1 Tax=Caldisalinibacter kiritimatiensis TaxID=1304284 RepID=R1CNE3_9FIRM|nr:DUF134 domain-containing protein [Caldisalinibacter kiritimatiensis]EOD00231.1 Protein of unknown function DUF134 [Caldisalinibacter kiritimatiensis]